MGQTERLAIDARRLRRHRSSGRSDHPPSGSPIRRTPGRTAAAAALTLLMIAIGGFLWTRTDRYQLRRILLEAPALMESSNFETIARWRKALARSGQVTEALALATRFELPADRCVALGEVAEGAFLQPGKREDAKRAAGRALDAARESGDQYGVLATAATALAGAGEFERAAEVARGIPDPAYRAFALVQVADAMLNFGQGKEARRTAVSALEAGAAGNAHELIQIAEIFEQLGDTEIAVKVPRAALVAVRQL